MPRDFRSSAGASPAQRADEKSEPAVTRSPLVVVSDEPAALEHPLLQRLRPPPAHFCAAASAARKGSNCLA
jgi:hypothetical protein